MGHSLSFVGSSLYEESDDDEDLSAGVVPMVNIDKVKRLSNSGPCVACRYHLEEERSLHADYNIASEVLGQGVCGQVLVVNDRIDDHRYALKMLNKKNKNGMKGAKPQKVVNEAEIHLS